MPQIRLIPSTYELSNTQYLSVSNASNMYTNTDSTTYATVTNSRTSTTSYYIYLRGFNFSDVPSDVIVNSITIKLKASHSGGNTGTIYGYNGTTQVSTAGSTTALGTSATVKTFTNTTIDWDTLKGYGSDFGIRINCKRNSRNTQATFNIYGAEILVDYTIPVYHSVSFNNTSSVSISPSTTQSVIEGNDLTIQINTDDISSIEVLDNDTNVNDSLVQHSEGESNSASTVLGTYALVSGSFDSGESYFSGLSGNGVDAAQTTDNYYSSGSGTIAVFTYDLNFSNIPSNATITRLYVQVNGHAESTSNSNEYMCVQLISGSTTLSEELNFKNVGTSNSTQTIEATTLPTISQLSSLKLQCRLGYYGGAINGATCYVEYTIPSSSYYYTYTISNISADHVIVIADASAATPYFMKVNGEYKPVKKFFRKVDGEWVEIDISQVSIAGPFFYKGWQEEISYDVLGEVTRSSSDTSIIINDNALSSGNYTLYYEDEGNNILSDVDEIANITIS